MHARQRAAGMVTLRHYAGQGQLLRNKVFVSSVDYTLELWIGPGTETLLGTIETATAIETQHQYTLQLASSATVLCLLRAMPVSGMYEVVPQGPLSEAQQ